MNESGSRPKVYIVLDFFTALPAVYIWPSTSLFFVTYKEYMTPSLHCYTEKIIFPLIPKVSHSNTSYHTQITAWFVRFDRAALEYHQFAIDLSNYKFIVTIIVDIG